MKKSKKLFSFALALCLMLSLSVSAFAANHDVGDFDTLGNVFSTDTDAEVNINLTDDISFDSYLNTNEGQTYTIGSTEGHQLSNVMLRGSGDVVINTDLSSDDSNYGIINREDVSVTVNGDINAQDGIYADGSSTVTVNGDIYAKGHAVVAFGNSQVIVEGDVSSEYIGMEVGDEADITVNGDVYGRIFGIHTTNSGDVTVNGDVSSRNYGIQTQKDSNVTVNGDVSSNYLAIQTLDSSSLSVTGDVSGSYITIQSGDSSSLSVTGDVSGGNFGIHTIDSATVTVDGNVSAADGDPSQVDFSDPESYANGGTAVIAVNKSSVTISGDACGGDAYGALGTPGRAVKIEDSASVTIGGRAVDGQLITSRPEPTPSGASSIPMAVEYSDSFWQEVTNKLRNAAPGEEITVDAGERDSIPMSVINTLIEQGVTLIIQWDGGEDIVISPDFELDESLYSYSFSELSQRAN